MSLSHRLLATPLLACALVAGLAAPGAAETIHLKNGTLIKGKIVKEDARTFSVETPDGRRKIAKADVEVAPTPDPVVAAILGLVPGAGLVYVGEPLRGAFFAGLGGAAGVAGYFAARQIRPTSPSTAMVTAIVAAEVVGLLGAWEATSLASSQSGQVRYRIDYE